jgi:hypothetical protein
MPAVREAGEGTIVIADGFSCKTQIEQMTERRALHTAQVIEMALERGPSGVVGQPPEEPYPDLQMDGDGRVREVALIGGVVAAGAAAGAAALLRHR